MHGGIGVTWEHDLHLYLRRVVVDRQTYGDPMQQRDQRGDPRRQIGTTMTATTAPTGGLAEDLGTFRARAKEWVTANLEPLNGADPYLGHATDDADHVVRAKAIQRKLFDAGFAGLCYPVEYGGRGLPAGISGCVHRRVLRLRAAPAVQHPNLHHHLADHPRLRHRRAEEAVHSCCAQRRRTLGPVPLRADRRVRPGRRTDPGGPSRRRLRSQRVQDLEHVRVEVGLRAMCGPYRLGCSQAQRAQRPDRQGPPTGNHDHPDQTRRRHRRLLSGVLRRRRRPRRSGPWPGRRRMERRVAAAAPRARGDERLLAVCDGAAHRRPRERPGQRRGTRACLGRRRPTPGYGS